MALVKFIPVVLLLAGCNTITYTASCRPGDAVCQRNQNAQTLAIIGHTEAATQLMCEDSDIRNTLGESCAGR
jgi:hypothetical protein